MGIVAGIGDLLNNKNLIRPKLDADIYNFIIGQNAIINGLQVIGNTLTAGTSLLKGYRGMLENDETLNGETYIYGKYTLNFNDGITDSFDILKTNTVPQDGIVNPASITTNGIYYLLLYTYTNGAYVSNVETFGYPVKAQYSDEAKHLVSGGTIDIDATAETLPVGTRTKQIATCKFVDNEINAQIASATDSGTIYDENGQRTVGTYIVKRKAKFCVLEITFSLGGRVQKFLSSGFYPKKTIYFCMPYGNGQALVMYSIDRNGNMTIIDGAPAGAIGDAYIGKTISIGYETN